MTEKKIKTTAKTSSKKATTKKNAVKEQELILDAVNAGYKAGDVYQALANAGSALTVAEIAKQANISEADTILGIGWLFKEGKIKGDKDKVTLA